MTGSSLIDAFKIFSKETKEKQGSRRNESSIYNTNSKVLLHLFLDKC